MSPVYEWGKYGYGNVYYYDNAWHDASKLQTVYIYDWNKRREYNDKTDWRAMQYSNKKVVMLPEPPLPTNYTVTIAVSPEWAGSVDTSKVTVAEWTLIGAEWNILSIGENVEVTATANDGYVFSSWGDVPATVTGDTSITATFWFWPLQNYVLSDLGNSLFTFGDSVASNYVQVCTETDAESWDYIVAVYVWWLFDDSKFVGTYGEEDQNWREYIFTEALEAEDLEYLVSEWEEATNWEWKSGVWSALQTYYATPTKANADAVITAIEATLDDGKLEPIDWTIPEPDPE